MTSSAQILELIPMACCHLDDKGIIDYVNAHAELLLHKKSAELLGFNICDIFPELKTTACYNAIEKALNDKISSTHDYVSVVTHGWIRLTAVPCEDGAVISFHNIDDLKNQELLISENILEHISDVIYAVDADFNFIYVNNRASKLWGFDRDKLLGQHYWTVFPDAVGTMLYDKHYQVLKDGKPLQFETVLPLLGVWIDVIIYPGKVNGLSVFFKDISEQKHRDAHHMFLSKINQDAYPLLTVQEVMDQLGERLVKYLNLSRCHFSIIDESKDQMEVIYDYKAVENSTSVIGSYFISDNFTELGRAHFREGKVAVFTAAKENPMVRTTADLMKQFGFLSFVEVPHRHAGQWKFLLSAGRAEVSEWRADEVDLLQELASSIYIRIEKVRAKALLREHEALYLLRLEKEVNQQTLELRAMINERKIAEQKLRESEERLMLLVNASSDMVYEMNADWTQMHQLRGKDFLADTEEPSSGWLNLYIPEQEQPRVWEAIQLAIEGKCTFEFEHQVLNVDGEIGWTHSRAVPVLDQQGTIIQWFGTAKDITQRKLSEEELSKNYTLLMQSEQLAGAGTWDSDLLSGKLSWSDGMYRLFGLEKGTKVEPEIYVKHALPTSLHIAKKVVNHIRAGKRGFKKILEIKIGEDIKVLQLKATLVRNEQGEAVRMLGVDMDITAVHEAERLIRDMESRQQQEIFRVTLNTQEEERRRISESLHNGLAQMLYGTKMAMDSMTIKLATEEPEKFNKAKKYTSELLADSIKESRLLSHKLMPTVLGEFGLNTAINDICYQMRGGTTFHCKVKPDKIQLDKYLEIAVFRTVQELILNVVKHAHATIASVEVIVEKNEVLIRVKDNGIGINDEKKEQTGIGLSSIRRKAALLKGSVELTSSPDKGTTVEVRLPWYPEFNEFDQSDFSITDL